MKATAWLIQRRHRELLGKAWLLTTTPTATLAAILAKASAPEVFLRLTWWELARRMCS